MKSGNTLCILWNIFLTLHLWTTASGIDKSIFQPREARHNEKDCMYII